MPSDESKRIKPAILKGEDLYPRKGLLPWMLGISLAVHVLMLLVQLAYQSPLPQSDAPPPPIEIAQIPEEWNESPPKPQAKLKPQIAESEKADNEKLDPNARFLSDRNQTAEQQTKAKITDDFRQKQGTGLQSKPKEGPASIAPTGEPEAVDEEEFAETEEGIGIRADKQQGIKRDWKTLSLRDLSVNGDGLPNASTDDHLSDVAEADRTVLSTREFRYYSYYHRIKVLLRQYWKPEVEKKLAMLWARGKTVKSREMTTRLLILLDQQGTLQRVSRLGSSGVREVDSAAEEAFKRAAPFPNPPKGIVDADGFVRIRWDFILKAQAAPAIQFQRRRSGSRPLP